MHKALSILLAGLFLAGSASAQVDLPRKKGGETPPAGGKEKEAEPKPGRRAKAGDIVPHLICSVCFEPNYTTPIDPKDEDGLQTAYCMVCRKATIHKQPASRAKGGQKGLDLPGGAEPTEGEPSRGEKAAGPLDPDAMETRMAVAAGYFASLERVSTADERVVEQAVESLVLLGDEGTAAARLQLLSEKAPVFTAAVRVLLRSKDSGDHDLVLERMRSRMPQAAAAVTVDDLVALDPVRASPALLISLLEHPQANVRGKAEDHLTARAGPELLPLLLPVLHSRLADARERALDLAIRGGGPEMLEVVLDRLDDTSASVAARAVDALAEHPDERVEFELLRRAFSDRWILRPNAYALLAVIEREDKQLKPILNEGHVEALLSGLSTSDPFVSGTCAAALAGIGFRASRPIESTWLDREVPERLVATVAGHVFFNDFSALRAPAQRRLSAIAGFSFGADGPRWAEWWLESRDSFHASRATLHVAAGDERGLEVYYRSGGAQATVFQLLGPDSSSAASEPQMGETVFLTQGEALDYVDLLLREGLLSVQCLPGQRGLSSPSQRSLEIRIAKQSKSFTFGTATVEPWFEKACALAAALRDRNRWQRYPDPDLHGDRIGLWRAQSDWWATADDPRVRALALKQLVLGYLAKAPASEGLQGVAELERLQSEESVLAPEDFLSLANLLDREHFFTARASRLLELCEQAGGLKAASLDAGGRERADLLIDLLLKRFDLDAAEGIAALLVSSGTERSVAAARDSRATLRAIAAKVLAQHAGPTEIAVLLELLRDSNEEVEIAALTALGRERVEEGRTELLVRARLGTPHVRAAALRVIGELGGENVLDALTVALTDPDPELKLAAAEGLASLRDSRATPMLISLLRQGRDAPWYQAVRQGLLRQGAAAEESLLALLRAPNLDMQREGALLLSARLRAESMPSLMRVLEAEPGDRAVAEELAVLSCVDYRAAPEPAAGWIEWWGTVVHDDPVAWLRAAVQQQGLEAPPPADFVPPATRAVHELLLQLLGGERDYLAERARRELCVDLERDLGALPPAGEGRTAWLAAVEGLVRRSRD